MPDRRVSMERVNVPVNTGTDEVIERKGMARAVTHDLSDEILYRWLYLGQGTREISRGLRIGDREFVEDEVKRRVTAVGPVRPPRPTFVPKKAA